MSKNFKDKGVLITEENSLLCKLIVEYRPRLYRIAVGILRNGTDAEDAVSETTCKAFANFHKLKDIEKFKSWIIKILINEAYAISNKRKRFVELAENIVDDRYDTNIVDTIVLWDAINALDDSFRIVAIMFYYEDMSIKEISKVLNIPVGTVNSRLNRSRQKLKKILIHEGEYQYV